MATTAKQGVTQAEEIDLFSALSQADADLQSLIQQPDVSRRIPNWTPGNRSRNALSKISRILAHSDLANLPLPETVRAVVRQRQRLIDTIFQHYLPVVHRLCKQYPSQEFPYQDRFQEGSLGLLRAIESYIRPKPRGFARHASWYVRNALLRAFREKSRLVRIPDDLWQQLHRLEKARQAFATKFGRNPERSEWALQCGLDVTALEHILLSAAPACSLDEPVSPDGPTLGETLEDPHSLDVVTLLQRESLTHALNDALQHLEEKERDVIARLFGLGRHLAQSRDDIARYYGIDREMVRKIERKALKRLRREDPGRPPLQVFADDTFHQSESLRGRRKV